MLKGPPKLQEPTPVPMLDGEPAWYRKLQEIGYPLNVLVIDFEAYFSKDDGYHMGNGDSALSTIEFVTDPRFEEVGHAVILVTSPFAEPRATFWRGDDPTYIRHLQREYGDSLEGLTVVAQNAVFDGTILWKKYGIIPPHFIDILGLARHEESRAKNDLGSLLKRHRLLPKGKTENFDGFHLPPRELTLEHPPKRIGPPRIGETEIREKWAAMVDYANHDAESEWQLFVRLMPRLSNAAVEARLMQHTLELFWKPQLLVDDAAAAELQEKMRARILDVVKVTGATEDEISGNNSFGALLGAALDEAGDDISKYQKDGKPLKDGSPRKLLAIAKDDEELDALKGHQSERVRQLLAARTAVKSWPLHIARVERIRRQARANGGVLPVPLKYCGAHTGRWSGGEKINLQNLGSRGDPLVTEIRHLLTAPEGRSLVIVDASQIEARVLDWIAGEDLTIWMDQSRDPYCEFASKMAGRTVLNTKKHKQAIPMLKKWHDRMRGMGKVGVLGCGYGMGSEKAQAYAANSYGVEMNEEEADRLVKTYRSTHPNVCRFWRMVEQKFKAAARYHETGVMDRGLKFHYEPEGDITVITLPNGRTLKYPHVKVSIINGRETIWMPNPMKPGDRTFLWGGTLTENIVQAISRDILALAVLNTEDAGYRVTFHCHDELVSVVPTPQAKEALGEIVRIMATPPAWASDCPLAAEGQVSKRYAK
jgi:hypothetical protein